MPTTPFDSFAAGDLIEAHNVSEMHDPIQNLERGKSFFAVADVPSSTTTAFVADLTPTPDSPHQTGLFVHMKVPMTNAAGSPDVTLELNGLGAKPILKGDGQSLAASDLVEDQMIALVYDEDSGSGGAFLLLSASLPGALFVSDGDGNTGLGQSVLQVNEGANNSAFGENSLAANTSGYGNAAFGVSAMSSNDTGYENCAFGIGALGANTYGVRNVALGHNACGSNDGGSDNVAVGRFALQSNENGNNNTCLGFHAGDGLTGSGNIVIGANIDVPESGEDSQINIGNCLLRNGPRQSVSVRAGSSAFANSSNTTIMDISALRGWIGFSDDTDGWCRLRVKPTGIAIEASSADWVASASPASGEVGLYVSSGELHMVLGSAAARTIGFTDQTTAF